MRIVSAALSVWLALSACLASAAEVTNSLSVSLLVSEIVMIDLQDDGDTTIELEITGECIANVDMCLLGVATYDFTLYGTTRVRVRSRPEQGKRILIGSRRFGIFDYQGAEPDAPPLYYDVWLEIVEGTAGPDAFDDYVIETEGAVTLEDLSGSPQRWSRTTRLDQGYKRGRIYIQPVFAGGQGENLILPVPGLYTTSINLLVESF